MVLIELRAAVGWVYVFFFSLIQMERDICSGFGNVDIFGLVPTILSSRIYFNFLVLIRSTRDVSGFPFSIITRILKT